MPKYTAELFRNTREVLYHDFEAPDDEAAKKYVTENTEQYNIEWIDREDSDADCDASDRLIDLYRSPETGELESVESGMTLKSEMPYSTDASELVKQLAALTLFAESDYDGATPEGAPKDLDWLESQDQALEALIIEARKLCGMSAPYAHPSMDLDGGHLLRMERGQRST